MNYRSILAAAFSIVAVAGRADAQSEYSVETSPYSFDDQLPGSVHNRPVSIYMAIDVTGSMSGNLRAIQNNILAFSDALRARNFDLLLGAVAFRDEIAETQPLTADVDVFKAFVTRQTASGGGDGTEASLLAIKESLNRIRAEDTRPNSLKTLLVIGDQPGHNGTSTSPRDCTLDSLTTLFNAIPEADQSQFRLFYSVDVSQNSYECGAPINAKEQMENLIATIFPTAPVGDRGAYVSYPFTGDSLQVELARLIEDASPSFSGFCLPSTARLEDGIGNVIHTWPEADLDGFRARGESLPLATSLSEQQYNTLGTSAKVTADYCCVLPEHTGDDFRNHCVMTKQKTIPVAIRQR